MHTHAHTHTGGFEYLDAQNNARLLDFGFESGAPGSALSWGFTTGVELYSPGAPPVGDVFGGVMLLELFSAPGQRSLGIYYDLPSSFNMYSGRSMKYRPALGHRA